MNIPQFASPKIEVNFVKEIFVINVISFKHNSPDWNVNTASRGLRYAIKKQELLDSLAVGYPPS